MATAKNGRRHNPAEHLHCCRCGCPLTLKNKGWFLRDGGPGGSVCTDCQGYCVHDDCSACLGQIHIEVISETTS